MKISFLKTNKLHKGFTLLEALIAVTIFTASILALLSILAQGISTTTYAKNKIVASYLAEEGVEYVRNTRDNFVLYNTSGSGVGWSEFKSNVTPLCDTGCYFNDNDSPVACGEACPELLYDENTGEYQYVSGAPSGYIRKIIIEFISDDDESKVSSSVSWVQGSGVHEVVFSDNLFNWTE